MTSDGTSPWWYSGDQKHASPQEPAGTGSPDPDPDPDARADGGVVPDWLGLLSGAQRLVEWAADAVLTPHAEHAEPRDHPQCLLCRASLLLGEGRRVAADPAADEATEEPSPGDHDEAGIRWLPIRD